MAETAAHLFDHVFPPLPVRQWVLAVPKRLRYFLHRGRRGQWPVYFGKPPLAIEASQHRIDIVLIGTPESGVAVVSLDRPDSFSGRMTPTGRLPTEAILHPLTPFRSLAVGQARKTPLKIERQLQCFWVVS